MASGLAEVFGGVQRFGQDGLGLGGIIGDAGHGEGADQEAGDGGGPGFERFGECGGDGGDEALQAGGGGGAGGLRGAGEVAAEGGEGAAGAGFITVAGREVKPHQGGKFAAGVTVCFRRECVECRVDRIIQGFGDQGLAGGEVAVKPPMREPNLGHDGTEADRLDPACAQCAGGGGNDAPTGCGGFDFRAAHRNHSPHA